MMQQVNTLMSTNLLMMEPSATVQGTAQAMAKRRVSSAFVVKNTDLLGIVTDRDLRVRAVAKALAPETPVSQVMTANPEWVEGQETVFAATLLMTQGRFHHLPVKINGETAGIVTTSDLVLSKQDDPVYLVQHISRQADVNSIKQSVSGMSKLMIQWVNSGMRAQQVSQILTAVSDAITIRLIQLAEEQFGPAPVPWCWAGFGS
jgi:CBS domain-containing protein